MLCEAIQGQSFMTVWLLLTGMGLASQVILSGSAFLWYYTNPTYEQWTRKSNPKYPTPVMVKEEIITMIKGLCSATVAPSITLYTLDSWDANQGFCGTSDQYNGWYHAYLFVMIWVVSDFYEWGYHQLGHRYAFFWQHHRHHHKFYNPSPFAVIADEYVDQAARSLPLLAFPLAIPVNVELLFMIYGVFFYGYGTYLHFGYEIDAIDAHNKYILSSYQHYLHHAVSIKNKTYHTGFFFKLWDQLADTEYTGKCTCAKCDREAGNRTVEAWNNVEKPDYGVLLSPTFWLQGAAKVAGKKV